MRRTIRKPKARPTPEAYARMIRLITGPHGRPREYPPCPRYDSSHRFVRDRCACGYEREPQEIVRRLLEAVQGERQRRVVQAVGMLDKIIADECKPGGEEAFWHLFKTRRAL